jgi:hypothetical protein
LRIFERGDALADLDAFDTGDGDDVARDYGFSFIAFEAAERVEFGDFGRSELAVELADANFFAAIQGAVEDAADCQSAEKFGIVQVGNLKLQDAGGIACRPRDFIHDRFEQRKQVLRIVANLAMGHTGARVGVDNRKVELILGGVEIDEEIVDFVEDFFRPRVGAVNFIQDHDWRKLGRECLLENVAGLRERAFAGVNEEHHAVDHAQSAFDFAAEIAVAWGVDDIDFGVVEKEGRVLG